ncbi:MAG: SRPBCC family protein [Paucibacter sp.]|nr:SRPBCC family protein [Roseateles sp.]
MMTASTPLNQIAFSVIDLRVTERWFREGMGFVPAGGSRLMMSSPLTQLVQGLPGAASNCWWLVGLNPWFQIEMFQFCRPMAKLMPDDARPCDIGYRRIGVWVADFDAALRRLAVLGTQPIGPTLGQMGDRRACVRNPDGVFVELLERDPLPHAQRAQRKGCTAAMRSITLSTPDLARSVATFQSIGGREPLSTELHAPEHEALWNLPGAHRKSAVLECGDILVEVVQYLDPAGQPWPSGYRICDQGILNVAFGARTKRDHTAIYQRALAVGARPNHRPIHLPGAGVVYVNDALGFSIEILWMSMRGDKQWGFVQMPIDKRPSPDSHQVEASVEIEAPLEEVWATLNDPDRMDAWIGFESVRVQRDGFSSRNGRGSERLMRGTPGVVVEQVVAVDPKRCIRYRVIQGSPFIYHLGNIELGETGRGHTRVAWSIRFRSKVPFLGGFWHLLLQRLLHGMLRKGLKPYVEHTVLASTQAR